MSTFPRPRLPLESREAQITVRMPPEWRDEIDAMFGKISGYKFANDFYLDLLRAGMEQALESIAKAGKNSR